MAAPDLSGYVDVAERLRVFFARYPDGSVQNTPPRIVELDGKRFLEVTASAYRTPNDPRPAVATAWEPWPGRTPYTLDSEAMNCETSAVGRALAFLGLEVRRSVATAQDVANRQPPAPPQPVKQRMTRIRAGLARHGAASRERQRELIEEHLGRPVPDGANLTTEELDRLEEMVAGLDTDSSSDVAGG